MFAPRRRLTLVVLVLLAVTILAVDSRTGALSPLRSAVARALGPVQRSVGGVVGSDSAVRRDNARLREQLAGARLDAATAEELRRLRLLSGRRVRPGRVVALGATAAGEWTATVGIGARDGVARGMTVVAGAGLVGRVVRTEARTALVLLAVDPTSTVGARLAGSGQIGLCAGAGLRPLRLRLLDPRAPVTVGEAVSTGPAGAGTFSAGVPIGRVRSVSRSTDGLLRTATVDPAVDFTALDLVGVVLR